MIKSLFFFFILALIFTYKTIKMNNFKNVKLDEDYFKIN